MVEDFAIVIHQDNSDDCTSLLSAPVIRSIALRRGVRGSDEVEQVARGDEVLAMGEVEEQEEEEEGEGVSLGAPSIAPPVSRAGLSAVRMAEAARREGGRAAREG